MTTISGISDFLQQAGTSFRVFDMGRRMQPMNSQTFLDFEQGRIPYPWPLQQQAWLGLLLWQDASDDDLVIWFIRFPLDANGHLTAGIRDDFVYRLLKKEQQQTEDEANPYGFKPKQEHMACFHAKAARILGKPPSRYYSHAVDYFQGKPGFDQWAFVGLQGIADVCVRLDEANHAQMLVDAIPQLPPQPLDALCQCLEHETVPEQVATAIAARLQQELDREQADRNIIALCLRALSGCENPRLTAHWVQQVLQQDLSQDAEILASISGRCWETLKQPAIIHAFLEQMASCPQGQEFFNLVIVDLINIPGMQDSIHQAMRQPERSARLSKAIGTMFQQFTQ
ncbi:MAG: DUF3549 family protein [Gammaproteobacteria bacterium]|nr:MAG: DUF3549 family protein [Gammaproteobacteria bacterium]